MLNNHEFNIIVVDKLTESYPNYIEYTNLKKTSKFYDIA